MIAGVRPPRCVPAENTQMCTDNPELPKEANKAKCFVISCFVLCALSSRQPSALAFLTADVCAVGSSLFSILGFGSGIPGIIGGIAGILACVGSSILMCCAPKTSAEGPGKFNAAGILLYISGSIEISMAIWTLIWIIMAVSEVNSGGGYCGDRYKSCDTDDHGCSCTTTESEYITSKHSGNENHYCHNYNTDGICYHQGVDWAGEPTICSDASTKKWCEDIHGTGSAVVTGIILIIGGIFMAFAIVAGVRSPPTAWRPHALGSASATLAPRVLDGSPSDERSTFTTLLRRSFVSAGPQHSRRHVLHEGQEGHDRRQALIAAIRLV